MVDNISSTGPGAINPQDVDVFTKNATLEQLKEKYSLDAGIQVMKEVQTQLTSLISKQSDPTVSEDQKVIIKSTLDNVLSKETSGLKDMIKTLEQYVPTGGVDASNLKSQLASISAFVNQMDTALNQTPPVIPSAQDVAKLSDVFNQLNTLSAQCPPMYQSQYLSNQYQMMVGLQTQIKDLSGTASDSLALDNLLDAEKRLNTFSNKQPLMPSDFETLSQDLAKAYAQLPFVSSGVAKQLNDEIAKINQQLDLRSYSPNTQDPSKDQTGKIGVERLTAYGMLSEWKKEFDTASKSDPNLTFNDFINQKYTDQFPDSLNLKSNTQLRGLQAEVKGLMNDKGILGTIESSGSAVSTLNLVAITGSQEDSKAFLSTELSWVNQQMNLLTNPDKKISSATLKEEIFDRLGNLLSSFSEMTPEDQKIFGNWTNWAQNNIKFNLPNAKPDVAPPSIKNWLGVDTTMSSMQVTVDFGTMMANIVAWKILQSENKPLNPALLVGISYVGGQAQRALRDIQLPDLPDGTFEKSVKAAFSKMSEQVTSYSTLLKKNVLNSVNAEALFNGSGPFKLGEVFGGSNTVNIGSDPNSKLTMLNETLPVYSTLQGFFSQDRNFFTTSISTPPVPASAGKLDLTSINSGVKLAHDRQAVFATQQKPLDDINSKIINAMMGTAVQKASVDKAGGISLQQLFKMAVMDKYMPNVEATLGKETNKLQLMNWMSKQINTIMADTKQYELAASALTFKADVATADPKKPDAGIFQGQADTIKSQLETEKNTVDNLISGSQSALKDIDQIIGQIDSGNPPAELVPFLKDPDMKSTLMNFKNDLIKQKNTITTTLSQLQELKSFIDPIQIVQKSDQRFDITMNGTLIKADDARLGKITNMHNVIINGKASADRNNIGLTGISTSLSTLQTNTANQSQTQQMKLQQLMTNTQQMWTIVGSALQILNQVMMTFARAIKS